VTWAVNEGDVADQFELGVADGAGGIVFLFGLEGLVALGRGTADALENLGVGIAKFDGDVTEFLSLVLDSLVREH
jgi:hypothetical protein